MNQAFIRQWMSLCMWRSMKEVLAVFTHGKRFSMMRNRGEELPVERIQVGNSMVLPVELADAWDQMYPPGPATPKRVTERRFEYELVYLGEVRMGASVDGLIIRFEGKEWDVLKKTEVFFCGNRQRLKESIVTTKCNRFDVIKGWLFTFVVDKVGESLSVLRAKYRIDNTTFCDETPIYGGERQYLEGAGGEGLGSTYFPFVPFGRFWEVWEDYVALRKRQIEEMRSDGEIV